MSVLKGELYEEKLQLNWANVVCDVYFNITWNNVHLFLKKVRTLASFCAKELESNSRLLACM